LPADAIDFLFEGQFVETRKRQGKEQADTAIQDDKGVEKSAFDLRGLPATAAGSGTPQWAVMGCPARRDRLRERRCRKTVKTKFIGGAPGLANSSQLLLLKLEVGRRAASSCFKACGLTRPAGKLPAL